MNKKIEKKIKDLEKRVIALELRVQAQPIKFVPEDSNGVCKDSVSCEAPR